MDDQDDFGFADLSDPLIGWDEMFNSYDSSTKKYIIIDSSGSKAELTTQELYEYYIFNDHGIRDSFEDVIKRLDTGLPVTGDDCEWDWSLGTSIRRGTLTIRAKMETLKSSTSSSKKETKKCNHSKKYVAVFTTFRYWYCPDCKEDLGDA